MGNSTEIPNTVSTSISQGRLCLVSVCIPIVCGIYLLRFDPVWLKIHFADVITPDLLPAVSTPPAMSESVVKYDEYILFITNAKLF